MLLFDILRIRTLPVISESPSACHLFPQSNILESPPGTPGLISPLRRLVILLWNHVVHPSPAPVLCRRVLRTMDQDTKSNTKGGTTLIITPCHLQPVSALSPMQCCAYAQAHTPRSRWPPEGFPF